MTQDEFSRRFKAYILKHSRKLTPREAKGVDDYVELTAPGYWRQGAISPEEAADEDMRCW